jgi:dienelactone hydrolase
MAFDHDGVELVGQLALPQTPGPHPAVMVMHNALGLSERDREKARQLARLGYAAVATDMYGGERQGDDSAAGKFMMELRDTPQRLRARTVAWYEQLKTRPEIDPQRIAALGYCFGGLCVLELARSGADVKAVVSYHGLLTTSMPARPGEIGGYVSVYAGGKDPYAPPEHIDALRQELTAAGARFQATVFDEARHAFTDPGADAMGREGIAYNAVADRVSWAGTVALLEATLSKAP